MNTKIIKKIAKANPIPNTHGTFMIQGNNGIVLSLDAGYCFDRPDFITEDGIYKAEYPKTEHEPNNKLRITEPSLSH